MGTRPSALLVPLPIDRAGEITGFTGIDPYEAPEHPELVLNPADGDPTAQAARCSPS